MNTNIEAMRSKRHAGREARLERHMQEIKEECVYEEYTSPETTDKDINHAVVNVIKTLNGMTISQAEAVLLQANIWLKATHFVDINSIEFLKFQRVFECVDA